MWVVTDFDQLVAEAAQVAIEGWDFGWLDGRAIEERPTWRTGSWSAPPTCRLC
jgi:hypothetical protein